MPQSVATHKALHVATIKRTTRRDSTRGQTAPEAVPGPRDFSGDKPVIPQPQPIKQHIPGPFHGDRCQQMMVGYGLLAFVLLFALPLYAFLTR